MSVINDALGPTIALLRQALAHDPADRSTFAELSASFDEAAIRLGSRRIKVLEHVDPPSAAPPSLASTKPRSVFEPPAILDPVSNSTVVRPPLSDVVPVVSPPPTTSVPSNQILVGFGIAGVLALVVVLLALGRGDDASNDTSALATGPNATQGEVESSSPSSVSDAQSTATTIRSPIESPITVSIARCDFPLPVVDLLPWGTCTKGDAVQLMQDRLYQLGYSLDPDGYFGPETELALQRFQRDQGLVVNGIVDYATWRALFVDVNLPGFDYDGDGVLVPGEIYYD